MKKVQFPRLQKQVEFVFLCKDSAWNMDNEQIIWEIWKNFYQHRSWCEFEIPDNSISKAVKEVKRKLRHIDATEKLWIDSQKLGNELTAMRMEKLNNQTTEDEAQRYRDLPWYIRSLFFKI